MFVLGTSTTAQYSNNLTNNFILLYFFLIFCYTYIIAQIIECLNFQKYVRISTWLIWDWQSNGNGGRRHWYPFQKKKKKTLVSPLPPPVSSGSKFELNEINYLFFCILSMYIIPLSGSPTYVLYVIVHA